MGRFSNAMHQIGVAIALQQFDICRLYAIVVLRLQVLVHGVYLLCLRHILEVDKSMSVQWVWWSLRIKMT